MLELKVEKDSLLVKVTGDLDLVVAKEFREKIDEQLEQQQKQNLIVDLSQVKFIDSSGLGAILGRYKIIQGMGGKMTIIGANPTVYRILDLSGVMKIITVFKQQTA